MTLTITSHFPKKLEHAHREARILFTAEQVSDIRLHDFSVTPNYADPIDVISARVLEICVNNQQPGMDFRRE